MAKAETQLLLMLTRVVEQLCASAGKPEAVIQRLHELADKTRDEYNETVTFMNRVMSVPGGVMLDTITSLPDKDSDQ